MIGSPLRQWSGALAAAVLLHFALGWLLLARDSGTATPAGHAITIALAPSGSWSPSIVDPVRPEPETARVPAQSLSAAESQAPALEARRVEERSRAEPELAPAVRAHRREEARKTDAEDASEQAMANPRQALSGATHESDKLPVPISGNPRPAYPLDARRRGYEGRVHVEVAVSASGAVARAVIKKSSGYRSLDQAALQAVARWQFRPAERGGKATEHMLEIPIVFRLRTPSG